MIEQIKPKPNQQVIELLEGLIEEAMEGKIQSIAVAGVYCDCATFNCFDGNYYPVSLIGEIRILERDVVDVCVDTRRKPAWEYCE